VTLESITAGLALDFTLLLCRYASYLAPGAMGDPSTMGVKRANTIIICNFMKSLEFRCLLRRICARFQCSNGSLRSEVHRGTKTLLSSASSCKHRQKRARKTAPARLQRCAAAAAAADAAAEVFCPHPAAKTRSNLQHMTHHFMQTTCMSWRERLTSSMESATASSWAWRGVITRCTSNLTRRTSHVTRRMPHATRLKPHAT
jgi:hypothetical protein